MKSRMKAVCVSLTMIAMSMVSGCGGGGVGASSPAAATPVSPPTGVPADSNGANLYEANCASCHGALANSEKIGATAAQIQVRMAASPYASSTLSPAEVQAIADALAVTTPPATVDGPALYAANCASCHSALATSAKKGASAAQIQSRMAASPFASRTLTPAEVQAIAAALAVTTPPATIDGPALYAANCASCHGALASSAKKGATAAQIQTRMAASPFASRTLTPAEVQAIADVLFVTTPPPPPVCGSCHAIPPSAGKHSKHRSQNIACATCHGSGYSTTSVNAATHANGVKNLTTTIGWNATNRSCANSCHGSESW